MFWITVKMYWCWIAVSIQHRQSSEQSGGVSSSPQSVRRGWCQLQPRRGASSSWWVVSFPLVFNFSPMSSSSDLLGWQLRPWPLAFCPKLTELSYFRNPGKWMPWISTGGASSVPLASASVVGQDESPAAVTGLSGWPEGKSSFYTAGAKQGGPTFYSLAKTEQDLELIKGWDQVQLRLGKEVTEDNHCLCAVFF